MRNHAIGLMLAVGALLPAPVVAQEEETSLAYPNVAFTFATAYVAEDAGLFAKHGLKLKPLLPAGSGCSRSSTRPIGRSCRSFCAKTWCPISIPRRRLLIGSSCYAGARL